MTEQERGFSSLEQKPETTAVQQNAVQPAAGERGFTTLEQSDPLQQTLGAARKAAPDQAARIFNLQVKTGLPAGLIERNLEEVERQAAAGDFDAEKFRRESPLLAQWLQENPQHAQLAQDDLEPLGAIEAAMRIGRRTMGALSMGPMLIGQGFWGATRAGAEVLGADELAAFARDTSLVAQQLATKVRGSREGVGFVEGAVYGGIESLSMMATATAATAFSGGGALALMGGATGGQAYNQAREKGAGVAKSTLFASWQAAVEIATEKLPVTWFLKDLAKNAPFKQVLAHQMKSELYGEQIATALQDLGEWAALEVNEGKTFTDYLNERPSAAAETAIATIVAVGGQSGLVRALEAAGGKPTSQQLLEDLHANVAASQTQGRSPDAMRAFLGRVTKDVPEVYVDGRKFVEYFQQDADAMAAELGTTPAALRQAVAAGGDIAIPTASYLSKMVGTGHEAFFTEEVRLGPDAENTREARERMAREASEDAAEDVVTPQRRVFNVMRERVLATNRVSPQEADTYATLWSLFYKTMAQGHDDDAFADRFIAKLMPHVSSFVGPYAGRGAEGGPGGAGAAVAEPTPTNVEGGIPTSRAGKDETPLLRSGRRAAHLEALSSYLTREAQAADPDVDPEAIRSMLDTRLAAHEERQDGLRYSGRGQDLLRTVAELGGIRVMRSGEDRGEVAHVRSGTDVAGSGGFARAWNGVRGVFQDGPRAKDMDLMARALMEHDQRFAYLEDNMNNLLDALDEAMRAEQDVDELPGTDNLEALGITPGSQWWRRASQTSETAQTDVDDSLAAGEEGDASFEGFNQSELTEHDRDPRVKLGMAASVTRNTQRYGDPAKRSTGWLLGRQAFLEQRITEARSKANAQGRAGAKAISYEADAELELLWVREALDERSDRDTATPLTPEQMEAGDAPFNPGAEFQTDQTPAAPRPRPSTAEELAAAADGTQERSSWLQQRRTVLEGYIADAYRRGRHDIAAENELRRIRDVLEPMDTEAERLKREMIAPSLPFEGFNQEELEADVDWKGRERQVNLDVAPAVYRNGRLMMSTRVPDSPHARPTDKLLETRLDVAGPVYRQTAARLLARAPRQTAAGWTAPGVGHLLTDAERKGTADEVLERAIGRMEENLRWLWDQYAEYRDRAKLWYVGAEKIAQQLAEANGISLEQAAAVIAVQSPQRDWFQNVALARRAVDTYLTAAGSDAEFTEAHYAAFSAHEQDPAKRRVVRRFVGQRWSQLSPYGQAVLLRELDEAKGDRRFRVITPEGTDGDWVRNEPGSPYGEYRNLAWGTYKHIANAIAVLKDGSPANISHRLGGEHKVRSFYNNIIDPTFPGAVTIDTHAIAAAAMLPIGGNEELSLRVMGGLPASAPVGISGLNPVVAEAYFRLAAKLTAETGQPVLPREVQSVTWEAVRGLFRPEQKRSKTGKALLNTINQVWQDHQRGVLSRDEARARILAAAGGIRPPDWRDDRVEPAADEGNVSAADGARRRPGDVPAAGGGSARRAAGAPGRAAAQQEGAVRGRYRVNTNGTVSRVGVALRASGGVVSRSTPVEFNQDDEDLNLSDQDRSHREWAANAARVAADPDNATTKDLYRAMGYLSHRRVALVRYAEKQGRTVDPDVLVGIESEIQWYQRLIVSRRGDTEFHQDLLDGGGFYSRIVKAVEDSTTAKASGKQWKATIRNAKSGINQDEFALARVEDLADGTSYTKTEVLQYLSANLVRVADVTLGDLTEEAQEQRIDERAEELFEEQAERIRTELQEEAEERWDHFDHGASYDVRANDDVFDLYVNGELQETFDDEDAAEFEGQRLVDALNDEEHDEFIRGYISENLDENALMREVRDDAKRELEDEFEAQAAKYESYTLDGADNGTYREVFLTLPSTVTFDPSKVEIRRSRMSVTQGSVTVVYDGQVLSTYADEIERRGPEFPEDRIRPIPHDADDATRQRMIAERADELREWERTHHRYEGHPDQYWIDLARQLFEQGDPRNGIKPIGGTWRDGHGDYNDIVNPIVRLRLNVRTLEDGRGMLFLEEVQAPRAQTMMPELVQKNWRELAFKWALRHAAANGLDVLGWTTGAQQVKRYDLRKVVEKIEYYPGSKQLAAYKHDGSEALREYDIEPDRVKDYIGEELAEKLLATTLEVPPPKYEIVRGRAGWMVTADGQALTRPNTAIARTFASQAEAEAARDQDLADWRQYYAQRGKGSLRHRLTGAQLAVGGEGISKLYDQDFRNVVQKLPAVKKHGGKVGTAEIVVGTSARLIVRTPAQTRTGWAIVDANTNTEVYTLPSDEEFRERIYKELARRQQAARATETVHALPITPELREAVLAGQALFQEDAPQPELPGARSETSETAETGATPAGWQTVEAGPETPHAKPGKATKGTYNPTTNTIKLLKAKNRSTFIHESAHAFLEIMSELALEDGAPPRLQRDMATLLQWFEFDGNLKAWRALSHEERRGAHEKFARGFELYLAEGKAPAPELQPLYARFRVWLLGVYKTLQRLRTFIGGEMPADVRAVMDRMLATEEAIAAAEQDAQVAPLFTTAADAGVSDTEFEGYQGKVEQASAATRAKLEARITRELQREQEAAWQDERAHVREQVAAEVRQQGVYRAMAAMRGELEGFDPAPLSRELLVQQYGKGILRQLPRPYLYSSTSGLPADTLAQAFGFPSGQALLDAIIAAPDVDQVIDEQTDERMLEEHGSILNAPELLADQARAAVAGEHRDQVVRSELQMLKRLRTAAAPSVRATKEEQQAKAKAGVERLRTELPDDETLRRLAGQTIAGMKLQQIRPDRFLATMRRASKEATAAAAKQDFDTAIEAKQTELTNLALYRAALEAKQAVEDARDRFQGMFGADDPMAKRRNMDYVHAARAIAAEYFFPERRLEKAYEALELIRKHDPEMFEQLEEQIRAVRAAGASLPTMTYEAFQGMAESVDALWEQSLRAQQNLVNGQLVDRAEIEAQLEGRLDELETPPQQEPRTKGQMFLLGVRAALRRVEHWVDYMDGGAPEGVFRRYIWNPVTEATTKYRAAREQYLTKYLELLKPIEKTLAPGPIEAPELGFTFESKAQLLHALLHTGNDSNFQKLLRGYGWGPISPGGVVDASRFRAFLDRAHAQGVVTKADWDFVQAVWDLLEESKGEAQRAHREMYGRYFSEITARPVPTPFGTYRGGYVPAIVDSLQAGDAAQREEGQLLAERDNAAMFPSTSKGFTKARVEQYAKPLALDLRLLPGHLDKVLRFIHLQPTVRDVGRLLWKWRVRERLNAYDPTAVTDILVPWLQRTVQQRVSQPSSGWSGKAADQFWRTVRTRTGLNMMVANVVNTLQQFTGVFPAALKVSPRYLRNGLYRYVTDHKRLVETVNELSPFMRSRTTAQAFEIQKTIDDIILNPSKYEQLGEFASKHGYFLQQGTQNVVDLVVWSGAFEEATGEGVDQAEAVRRADAAVRMTQGSFAPEDLAAIDTKSAFTRAFVMFYGYFNMLANLNGTELAKVVRDVGLRKGAGRALYIYAFGFMAPAVVGELIRQAAGGFEEDDDEFWIDEALALFFGSQFRQATAMLPGGQALNSVVNYFNDKPYDDRVSASPAITMIESATRAPKSVYDAALEDGSKKRAVRDLLSAVGLFTRLPVGALGRPAGYLADVVDEREEPENPYDLARGLVTGRGAGQ